ncbi:DEAD/DEAH box helicase [Halorubrum ezzemoulense]|jgi:DNA excision repair protein ERCC-3|uniref:Putative DNA 3'-5' helicase Rad25 n=2 Tax=Halorubrum ezzemoulense TaxID=337243 RepID=A0A256IY87_HALEZ|nr:MULTISPECIES: DEAD/DEAH box helicase [Halorubrum]MDB2223540.1 DEAD/DEAH box helicase [Halorubrum ezzemoulense]MDB2261629.1 DEAD/DEAH box helicase [Halorubrum ezzemoulense]MDB2267760.1 DEAD/DEAH box helicase [Halorubrum ezzemoulense]MDB2274410.1 DEAD/DEAH box helicase [Halorubrum ezzemoulense]MDB9232909.1 DEAD/DEAH box helicase [Halorubrum ezzemoulense]
MTDDTGDDAGDDSSEDDAEDLSLDRFHEALEAEERPVATASEVARRLGTSQAAARDALAALVDRGDVDRLDVEADPVVFYPRDWGALASRERVVTFPKRREIVVDRPTQYTRARLSQFANLVDTTGTEPGTRGYLYRIRQEDVWAAPFDDADALVGALRSVLPRRYEHLEAWVRDQWRRAHRFRLYTHADGYVVLEAASENLMGNVADQHLDDDHLRAPISDTEAWVNEAAVAAVKRTLYDAGYPVEDDRDLETGDPVEIDLATDLRDYQETWVETFLDRKSGVYVGPPGSGKTVAGIATIAAVGGETLILVPSRELADQWREELLEHSTVDPADIGLYHGGTKEIRPVTIATYQIAGMDRHRSLFDSREWGLICFDECHHVTAPVYSRTAELQSKHRLGLSATPVSETGSEEEIYTLIGQPIGADWDALFEAGFVQEPEVEIRYVPWRDETARNEYAAADGRDRRRLAAENPAKVEEIRYLLAAHRDKKTLVFVEYLDQGAAIADALGVPFISGETPHHERAELFRRFRADGEAEGSGGGAADDDLDVLVVSRVGDEGIDLPNAELAVVASGLGGSRRQGSQRAGRTMRPTGSALVYVLATRGSSEEEFAQRQMRHLGRKGVRVRETNVAE